MGCDAPSRGDGSDRPVSAWLALLVLLVLSMSPTAAAHADETPRVEVVIDSISTPILDVSEPEQVVTLSGTVLNRSQEDLRNVVVHFWRYTEAITTHDSLTGILASPATSPVGARLRQEASGHLEIVARDDPFRPGETATFTVSATVEELGFSTDDAVYLLGAHVRVVGHETVGRGRILAVATQDDLPRTTLTQLSTTPTLTTDGDFTSDHLTHQLTGPLMEMTRGAADLGSTILLDPALVVEARAMARPHTIQGVQQVANPQAAEWLGLVEGLVDSGQVMRLPYGNLDVARLAADTRLDEFLGWAEDAVPADLRELELAVQVGEAASNELLEDLSTTGIAAVFADNVRGGSIGGMAVVQFRSLGRLGMGPAGDDTQPQVLTRRLAEQLLARETPTYLLTTPDHLAQAQILEEHQTDIAPRPPDRKATATSPEKLEPWDDLMAEVERLEARAGFLADLTGEDDAPQTRLAAVTAASSAFPTEEEAIAFLRQSPVSLMDPNLITISAARGFVMGSRTSDFPVTIANGMATDVRVRMNFTSEVPQRISVPSTEVETVPAGESLTLNVAPEATSNGVVQVIAQLETAGGQAFGEEVPIQITATEFGRVGWLIIIVSGAVVLGGTVLRIRAVRAERTEEDREQPSQ